MDGWKDDWSREYKKFKRGSPGAWATRSNVQIRDKRKHTNKGQRKQERMYSIGVDYSTLFISSLIRYDEDTVLLRHHLQVPHPTWRRRRPRQRATARRLVTIDHALLVTMGAMLVVLALSLAVGMAKGQLGHDQRQFTACDCTSPQELRAVTKAEPPQYQDRLDQDPVSQRNQTYLLLQKATY
jgi:hypothetical protein